MHYRCPECPEIEQADSAPKCPTCKREMMPVNLKNKFYGFLEEREEDE